jgi:hypothetical protein
MRRKITYFALEVSVYFLHSRRLEIMAVAQNERLCPRQTHTFGVSTPRSLQELEKERRK